MRGERSSRERGMEQGKKGSKKEGERKGGKEGMITPEGRRRDRWEDRRGMMIWRRQQPPQSHDDDYQTSQQCMGN